MRCGELKLVRAYPTHNHPKGTKNILHTQILNHFFINKFKCDGRGV